MSDAVVDNRPDETARPRLVDVLFRRCPVTRLSVHRDA